MHSTFSYVSIPPVAFLPLIRTTIWTSSRNQRGELNAVVGNLSVVNGNDSAVVHGLLHPHPQSQLQDYRTLVIVYGTPFPYLLYANHIAILIYSLIPSTDEC